MEALRSQLERAEQAVHTKQEALEQARQRAAALADAVQQAEAALDRARSDQTSQVQVVGDATTTVTHALQACSQLKERLRKAEEATEVAAAAAAEAAAAKGAASTAPSTPLPSTPLTPTPSTEPLPSSSSPPEWQRLRATICEELFAPASCDPSPFVVRPHAFPLTYRLA